jgi:uncharacterized protein YlbG (UPF0298 family)
MEEIKYKLDLSKVEEQRAQKKYKQIIFLQKKQKYVLFVENKPVRDVIDRILREKFDEPVVITFYYEDPPYYKLEILKVDCSQTIE